MNKVLDILEHHSLNTKECVESYKELVSYGEIFKRARELSRHVLKSDIRHKNIGIYFPNSIEFIVAYFSAQILECISVPISTFEKSHGIYNTTVDVDIYTIISNTQGIIKLEEAFKGVDREYCIINIENGKKIIINEGCRKPHIKDRTLSSEVATILKTSGTTDNPKYVMLRHEGIINNIKAHIKSLDLSENDKTMIILPMCFGYCHTSQLLAHIYLGAGIYIYSGTVNPKNIVESIEKYNITNTTVVPSVLYLLDQFIKKKNGKIKNNTLKKLCFGGAKPDLEILKSLNKNLKETILVQTYGQTENSPRITTKIFSKKDNMVDTVGQAIEGVIIKIFDNKGKECSTGIEGDIFVKSNSLMKGYYNNAEATKKAIINGWLNTGDIGRLDDEGNLYISGREKNIIIRNGINISPEEIEICIKKVYGVRESLVIKESHPVYGEEPVALVLMENGYNEEKVKIEIKSKCKEELEDYKLPAKICFVEKIEKTNTGKVRR